MKMLGKATTILCKILGQSKQITLSVIFNRGEEWRG